MAIRTDLAGKKLPKDKLVFDLLGAIDEVSAAIGLAKVKANDNQKEKLSRIQKDLQAFSSLIAQCGKNHAEERLEWLEKMIENYEQKVDIPREFILAGKNELEARLNFARVVTRKAERVAIRLNREQEMDQPFLDYLNRLSWLLFLIGLES